METPTVPPVRSVEALLGIVRRRAPDTGSLDVEVAVPAHAMRLGSVHGAAVAAYIAYGGRRLAEQLVQGSESISLESCKVHHLRPFKSVDATLRARTVVRGDGRMAVATEVRAEKLIAFGWSSWRVTPLIAAGTPVQEAGRAPGPLGWREILGIELTATSEQESTVVQSSPCSADPERWVSLLTMVDCAALSLNLPGAPPKIVTAELGIVCGDPPLSGTVSAAGSIVQAGRRLVSATSMIAGAADSVAYGSATFAVL